MDEFLTNYKVYEDGRVQRVKNDYPTSKVGKFLKPEIVRGYQRVTLCYMGKVKRFLVHRLVAQVHLPNPDNLPVINHKDGNKQNNQVYNLEWTTQAMNEKHSYDVLAKTAPCGDDHYGAVLTDEQVREIRETENPNFSQMAREYGVHRMTVTDAYNYVTWKHIL